MGEPRLEVVEALHVAGQQAVAIDHEDACPRLGFAQAFSLHRQHDLLGDAAARRAGADEGHTLLADLLALGLAGRQQGTDAHRRGALNIIIEAAQFVAIAIQQRHGVGLGEILELQQHVRPATLHRGHEIGDEGVVLGLGHPRMAPAHVHRIVEQGLVVGADVESDRQRIGRADTATGGIQRQLADRNAHAADTLVAKAEDALAIGGHDHLDVVLGGAAQDVVHVLAIRVADEQPAMVAIDIGKLFARLAHGGGIDDRQHLLEVLLEQAEEQRLVVVLNGTQVDMPVEVVLAQPILTVGALGLLFDGLDVLRQQADQVESDALVEGEGAALVEQRHLEQGGAGIGKVQRALGGLRHLSSRHC